MSFQEINKPRQRSSETTTAKTSEKVFVRPLTGADLEAALKVAEETGTSLRFKEEYQHKLNHLSYLTLGIFTTPPLPKSSSCPPEPTYAPHPEILLGFCLATLANSMTLTNDTPHAEGGETIMLHNVAVTPEAQGKGIGTTLISSWLDRLREAGIGKRAVGICPQELVSWFKRFGFVDRGPSKIQMEGEEADGWREIRMEFRLGLSRATSTETVPESRWNAGFS